MSSMPRCSRTSPPAAPSWWRRVPRVSTRSTWQRQRRLASRSCGSPIILQTPWPGCRWLAPRAQSQDPRAYNRTREGNFALDGLMGFDLVGRTVAVFGTGKIGTIFARIMAGFGCKLLGFDLHHSPEFKKIGGCYAEAEEIQAVADVISLHCPLTPQTHHIVNARTLARGKRGHSRSTPAAAAWSTPRRRSKRSNAANSAAWRSTSTSKKPVFSSRTCRTR